MSSAGSVTTWTDQLKAGEAAAAQRLWERYSTSWVSSTLRTIALRKMENYTIEEIASQLGCVPRTVRRRLQRIRSIWENEGEP